MKKLGIYIHFPFCKKKCAYCDFYSVCFDKSQTEHYVNAVLRNLRHYSDKSAVVDTVYFGGGTPSLLTSEQIGNILNEINFCFTVGIDAEITIEANPVSLNREKLKDYRKSGINRLSIGVQSFIDNELKFLGRLNSAESTVDVVNNAVNVGFKNISCDLMIALPGQKKESLEYSINRLTELPIKHISAYILKVEKGTPFYINGITELLPSEDETSDLYLEMCGMLESKGFMQYEISNFAKIGFESRHNSRYWKCLDYIGIGPSAHSCYNGKRFAVPKSLERFIAEDVQPVVITDESPCGFEEYSMLRLRLKEGLKLERVAEHRNEIEKKLPPLVRAGYIDYDGEIVSLTRKGFLMSNSVIEYLIF